MYFYFSVSKIYLLFSFIFMLFNVQGGEDNEDNIVIGMEEIQLGEYLFKTTGQNCLRRDNIPLQNHDKFKYSDDYWDRKSEKALIIITKKDSMFRCESFFAENPQLYGEFLKDKKDSIFKIFHNFGIERTNFINYFFVQMLYRQDEYNFLIDKTYSYRENNSLFHEAVKRKNLEAINYIGSNFQKLLNFTNGFGETALHIAVKNPLFTKSAKYGLKRQQAIISYKEKIGDEIRNSISSRGKDDKDNDKLKSILEKIDDDKHAIDYIKYDGIATELLDLEIDIIELINQVKGDINRIDQDEENMHQENLNRDTKIISNLLDLGIDRNIKDNMQKIALDVLLECSDNSVHTKNLIQIFRSKEIENN